MRGVTALKTRITELLGIRYPVIQAPMAWITDAGLAGAVSAAGGLGTIGPNSGFNRVTTDVGETGERLREQIRKLRSITDRPFAVNFVVGAAGLDKEFSERWIEVGIEERVPVAVVSQGSPRTHTQRLKAAGMKVIHVCACVDHARKAEEAGVDAVVASGTEGGGHSGFEQITTFCLTPQVAEAVSIPVIAGGGIGDARGLVAAVALGAEGVYMGTRFIATQECPAHPSVKATILKCTDTGTVSIRHGRPAVANTGNRGFTEARRGSIRIIINDKIRRILTATGGKVSWEDIIPEIKAPDPASGISPTLAAFIHGDLDNYFMAAGQVSGLVRDIPTCRDLMERMAAEAGRVLERLNLKLGKEQ